MISASFAVPNKPDGFSNLVNSLRWAAMVPKLGSKSDSRVIVEDTASNGTVLAQSVISAVSQRQLLNAVLPVDSRNSDAHSSNTIHSSSHVLTPLLEPADAYRTVICIVALFGLIAVIHSCAFVQPVQ